jgi:hypothetical protein
LAADQILDMFRIRKRVDCSGTTLISTFLANTICM